MAKPNVKFAMQLEGEINVPSIKLIYAKSGLPIERPCTQSYTKFQYKDYLSGTSVTLKRKDVPTNVLSYKWEIRNR